MSWPGEADEAGAVDKRRSYGAIPPDTRMVLDVGCGSGDDVLALAEHLGGGALVVGVDSCFDAIEEARCKARNVALNVRFAVGDARCLPFGYDSFDVVWADGLFRVVGDTTCVARELARVTNASGRLLVRDRESALIDRETDVLGLLKRCGLGAVSIAEAWHDRSGDRQLSVIARKVGHV